MVIERKDVRKKYWWMYIPVISWLFTVFPLVLPPVPLGPIALSLSWSRRRMFSFYKMGCKYLGKEEQRLEFPVGWLCNVVINIGDIATLGLTQLFATAVLLKEIINKQKLKEKVAIDPVVWVVKWLAIGNVLFLALYILCPGIIYEPLLVRLERRLASSW